MRISFKPSKGRFSQQYRLMIVVVVLLASAFLITGCGPTDTATPAAVQPEATQPEAQVDVKPEAPAPTETTVVVEPTVEVAEVETTAVDPELEAKQIYIESLWKEGPHGNTYDLGKGPNTYCSRCHSPQNWDPAATTDAQPNCVTCKFPTDPELRIASTMDFVSEEDWVGIGCETCHPIVDGIVQPELAWYNPLAEQHEPVNTPTELCQKCHANTQGVSATGGRGVTHGIMLGGSAHANWAGALPQDRRPQYCSDCHDPHSTQPVECISCHERVLTLDTHMKGQAEAHQQLTCLACHDADGMLVGPHPNEDGSWVTLTASVSRSGDMVTEYVKSHSIQWQVDCSRCHYAENPWELNVLTPEGNPPEPSSN